MFFLKNKTCLNHNILLLQNIGKDLSDLKIVFTRDPSSLNHGPLNLLFRFTDS